MSKLPQYDVYVTDEVEQPDVPDESRKNFWTRIGAGWKHSDGKGIQIQLQAHPIGKTLILRVAKPKDEKSKD